MAGDPLAPTQPPAMATAAQQTQTVVVAAAAATAQQLAAKLAGEQQLANPALCWARGGKSGHESRQMHRQLIICPHARHTERFSADYHGHHAAVPAACCDTVNMVPLPDFLLRQIDSTRASLFAIVERR